MSYHDEIVKIVEEGGNVDSIYLDFANTFDKLECSVLFHRLRDLRIYGKKTIMRHHIPERIFNTIKKHYNIIVAWVNIFHRKVYFVE